MNKDEQLNRLLRLKRYELPQEDFAAEFLDAFHRRQRSDQLKRSSLSLVWERVVTWLEGLRRPVVLYSLAGAYASLLLLGWLWPSAQSSTPASLVITRPAPQPVVVLIQPQSGTAESMPVSSGGNGALNVPPGKRRLIDEPVKPAEGIKHLD